MKDKLFSKLLTTYERQYSQIKGYKYSLRMSLSDTKLVDNFIDLLLKKVNEASVGEDFINSYIEFQLSYWMNADTKLGAGIIPLSWVFGKKALERWFESNNSKNKYKTKQNLKKVGKTSIKDSSTTNILKTKETLKQTFLELSETEEAMKEKTINQETGLLNCIQTTTLYNHKSSFCLICNFADKCKEIQKKELNLISKIRNNE